MSDLNGELFSALAAASEALKASALRVLRGEAAEPSPPVRVTEPFLTLQECARRLGLSACSLWRWQVPGHELGGRPKFRISEVEAYLESDAFRQRVAELKVLDLERRERRKRRKKAVGQALGVGGQREGTGDR